MGWITHFTWLLFAFTVHSQSTDNVPWTNAATGETFLYAFLDYLGSTGELSQQERDDMESISESLLSTLSQVSTSRGNIAAKQRAFSRAFAASIAEIVTEEGGGTTAQKAQAVQEALRKAFIQTTGSVDHQFVKETGNLINLFAQDQDNNIVPQPQQPIQSPATYGPLATIPTYQNRVYGARQASAATATKAAAASSATSTTTATTTTGSTAVAAAASAASAAGAAGAASSATAAYSSFAQYLLSALQQSTAFLNSYSGARSAAYASAVASATALSAANQAGLGAYARAIASAVATAVGGQGAQASAYAYAEAYAYAIAQFLSGNGLLNSSNAYSLATALASASSSSAAAAAASAAAASASAASAAAGASSSTTTTTTSSASASAAAAAASAAGASGSGGSGGAFGYGGAVGSGQGVANSGFVPAPADDLSYLFSGYGPAGSAPGTVPTLPAGLLPPSSDLLSPSATQRISSLVPSLLSAVSPNGLNASGFANTLVSLVSQISLNNGGLSASQVFVEAVFEVLVAIIQILSSAQIGVVNTNIVSATATAFAQAISGGFSG